MVSFGQNEGVKIIEGMKKDLRQTMVEECAEFKIYTKERKVIILNH